VKCRTWHKPDLIELKVNNLMLDLMATLPEKEMLPESTNTTNHCMFHIYARCRFLPDSKYVSTRPSNPNMVPWDRQIKSSEDISATIRRPYPHSPGWFGIGLDHTNFYVMFKYVIFCVTGIDQNTAYKVRAKKYHFLTHNYKETGKYMHLSTKHYVKYRVYAFH